MIPTGSFEPMETDASTATKPKWFSIREAAEYLDVGEPTLYRWMRDGKLRGILIEDKASGISALQTLEQSAPPEIAALLVPFQPGQVGKAARARQASLWCERGCVLLPEPAADLPWLFEFEDLLYKFPAAALNDPADSLAQAVLYLENLLAEGYKASGGRIFVLPSEE